MPLPWKWRVAAVAALFVGIFETHCSYQSETIPRQWTTVSTSSQATNIGGMATSAPTPSIRPDFPRTGMGRDDLNPATRRMSLIRRSLDRKSEFPCCRCDVPSVVCRLAVASINRELTMLSDPEIDLLNWKQQGSARHSDLLFL